MVFETKVHRDPGGPVRWYRLDYDRIPVDVLRDRTTLLAFRRGFNDATWDWALSRERTNPYRRETPATCWDQGYDYAQGAWRLA